MGGKNVNKKKVILIIVISILGICLIAGGALFYKNYKEKQDFEKAENERIEAIDNVKSDFDNGKGFDEKEVIFEDFSDNKDDYIIDDSDKVSDKYDEVNNYMKAELNKLIDENIRVYEDTYTSDKLNNIENKDEISTAVEYIEKYANEIPEYNILLSEDDVKNYTDRLNSVIAICNERTDDIEEAEKKAAEEKKKKEEEEKKKAEEEAQKAAEEAQKAAEEAYANSTLDSGSASITEPETEAPSNNGNYPGPADNLFTSGRGWDAWTNEYGTSYCDQYGYYYEEDGSYSGYSASDM